MPQPLSNMPDRHTAAVIFQILFNPGAPFSYSRIFDSIPQKTTKSNRSDRKQTEVTGSKSKRKEPKRTNNKNNNKNNNKIKINNKIRIKIDTALGKAVFLFIFGNRKNPNYHLTKSETCGIV